MVWRWLIWFLVIGVGVWLAGLVAANPGHLSVAWGDVRVDSSVAVLLVALLLLIALALILYRLSWLVGKTPASLAHARRARLYRQGLEALNRGLTAIAAGDPKAAAKDIGGLRKLPEARPVALQLSAQIAELRGDEAEAARLFQEMASDPATAFLGVRGLLQQAIRRQAWREALPLAERATQLSPASGWAAETLLMVQLRLGLYRDAAATLDHASGKRLLPAADLPRRRAEVLLGRSEETAGDEALDHARKAHAADPAFPAAAARYAHLLIGQNKLKKAVEVIEATWRRAPSPELAEVYWQATGATDALHKVRAAQDLARLNPEHEESRLAIAAAALEARLWGEARSNLEAAAGGEAPSPRVCRMMAALEEAENGDSAGARQWLLRASSPTTAAVTPTAPATA